MFCALVLGSAPVVCTYVVDYRVVIPESGGVATPPLLAPLCLCVQWFLLSSSLDGYREWEAAKNS